jgi:tyrosine-specific transport protein
VNESTVRTRKRSLLSAIFLVAGCCVGGGMLGLPVASGASGFIPSLVMMILCWLGMTLSALLLLEVSFWMQDDAHVITMTSKILGPVGKVVAWILFLYISYASVVAYAAGGGLLVAKGLNSFTGLEVSKDTGAILLTVVFTLVFVFGGVIVGRVNSILFASLILAYLLLVSFGLDEVKPLLLKRQHWGQSFFAIPLLLTSFSFQTIVPSLTPILKRQTNALRLAIIGGTTLALIIYAIWQFLILGIIPAEGPNGLIEANRLSVPATTFIRDHVAGRWVVLVSEYFGFFAIITSFLAMGLGLFDFLSDGLKIPKKGWGNGLLCLLIIIPTAICATHFERAFMEAMETSGGFGDTILNGMIPVLMVWIGRYSLGYKHSFKVPGGKPLLIGVFLFFFIAFSIEMGIKIGYLNTEDQKTDKIEIQYPPVTE